MRTARWERRAHSINHYRKRRPPITINRVSGIGYRMCLSTDSAEEPPGACSSTEWITLLATETALNSAPGDEIVTSVDIGDHPEIILQRVLKGFFSRIRIQDLTPYAIRSHTQCHTQCSGRIMRSDGECLN